ncbi:thioredoxin reductase (NADPH) [Cetobacterium ceti]|uniref:Thioredoxin reductase (NADPH) n=1 Tax=Cetobacterium ceti TaxID=180163 RepID=A0A1T4P843_9FUSO|nr:NAD(P)/FAD-dependent oxidoreductase [Cetobacterium ceti]SJZ87068.1 thioredoxin reductase (NADPH) [Cetobacterium ceti]
MMKNFDIIIIGGGPAGASAAIYAASRGVNVAIFEKDEIGGTVGKVSSVTHYLSVDNNESGISFSEKLKEQLKKYKVNIIKEEVKEVVLEGNCKKIITTNGEYVSKAIILANGSTPRHLNIPGEKEYLGKGLCKNAGKEGPQYLSKDIFIVGGADGAIKEAIYLSQFAKRLIIIHFEDELHTIAEFKDKLATLKNVNLELHSRLTKIEGNNSIITSIEITDEKTKEKRTISSEGCGIFIYAGATPNTELYKNLNLDNGYIMTDKKMGTNIPGVYAAGDICVKDIRQVATAVSDGTIAGINAVNYIK